jgi:hypothetical protein
MNKTLLTGAVLAFALGSLSSPAQTPDGKVDFEKQLLPIFKERCFDCHQKERTDAATGRVKKPKGKFRMDSAALMLKGGSEGSDLVPGDAAKSTVYTSTTLPAEHDTSRTEITSPSASPVLVFKPKRTVVS